MIDHFRNSGRTSATPAPVFSGRALELLERVLSSEGITVEELCSGLMVPAATIVAYRGGRRPMPIEVQLLLIAFTIERTPQHGPLARRMRDQLRATIAFVAGETVTHLEPPPR